MKSHIAISMICLATLLPSLAKDLPFGAPSFPPHDWQLRVSVQLNDGFVHDMKGIKEPGENAERAKWERFWKEQKQAKCEELGREITIEIGQSFSARSTAAMTGSDSNPLVTTNVPEDDFMSPMYEQPHLGFIPVHDQQLVYLAALHAASEFTFAKEDRPYSRTDRGIDISLWLEINRDSIWLHYRQVDPSHPLPGQLANVFSLLLRNLPKRYTPLFELFTLSKLAPIPEDAKTDYGKCPVHGVLLVPGIVKKTGGGWNKKYHQVEKEQFPEANVAVHTGWCGTGHDFSRDQHVLYCPKCRKSREGWMHSVSDLDSYRAEWARKKKQENHNKAIDGDEE